MITGVHISSSEMVINRDDGKKSSLPQFSKNQVIKATVVGLLPNGKAQLMVNGKLVTARTAMLLTPGEEVQLKVVQEKDAVVLKLIGPVQKITTGQMASLVSLFSKNEGMFDIFENRISKVNDLLQQISLKSDQADDEFLPRLIEKGGFVMEKKAAQILLSDKSENLIKTNLNQLMAQDMKAGVLRELSNAADGSREGTKTIASFLETLENFQLLNHHNSESGRILLPFPIFSDAAFRFGQLMIDTGQKESDSSKAADRMINISFLLGMTRLGPLRADFSILKQEISGRFLLCDDSTCNYFKPLIPELKAQLTRRNYQIRQIECSVARPEQIQPSSLIEAMVKSGDDRVLNIVV